MPRKGAVDKRDVLPEPVYNSKTVTRLVNRIMVDGKRGKAQSILYDAFELVAERSGQNAMDVFEEAMKNVMPVLEVRARRVGVSNYQVPMEVRAERSQALGLRYLVNYARSRSEKTMVERLANEILDASNNTGGAVKRREDLHKMAEANKAFAHYRW